MKKQRSDGKTDAGSDTQPIPVVPASQEGNRSESTIPGKDPRTRS